MKSTMWMLGISGLAMVLAGCVTTPKNGVCEAPAFEAKPAPGFPTGFLNKTLEGAQAMSRYVVYVPYNYTPDEAWPMIVFLHGAGERGSDGLIQSEVGIGTAIRRHADRFPAIVLMPQCPKDRFWDVILADMEQAIAKTREEYRIDQDRIYLTGLSMGGYGTWIWGATKTDTFAALMPICGGGALMDISGLSSLPLHETFGTLDERVKNLAKVPIWAFHGADDEVVPPLRTKQMLRLVEEAGGNVKYTEYPKTGHNSWDKAYGHRKAIEWLLSQRRK